MPFLSRDLLDEAEIRSTPRTLAQRQFLREAFERSPEVAGGGLRFYGYLKRIHTHYTTPVGLVRVFTLVLAKQMPGEIPKVGLAVSGSDQCAEGGLAGLSRAGGRIAVQAMEISRTTVRAWV